MFSSLLFRPRRSRSLLFVRLRLVQQLPGALAQGVGADPRAVVVATVIAGSCAYATPIGMPANTMVVGIGGYSFRDYVKAGLPLIGVSFMICMVLLPILFPFFPG